MLNNAVKTIVVGVDETNRGAGILKQAVGICRALSATSLHLITVARPHVGLIRTDHGESGRIDAIADMQESRLREAVAGDRPDELYVHARWGQVAEEIVHLAAEAEADLIIVGSVTDQGRARSVPSQVLRWAACSVLVLQKADYRDEEEPAFPHMVMCPQCIEARERTKGASWFCVQDSESSLRQARRLS